MIRVISQIKNRFGLSGLLGWFTSAHVRILQKPSINQLLLITPLTSHLKGGHLSLLYQAIHSKLVDFQVLRHLFSSKQQFLHNWLRYCTIWHPSRGKSFPHGYRVSCLRYLGRTNTPQCMQVNSWWRTTLHTIIPQWLRCSAFRAAGCFWPVNSTRSVYRDGRKVRTISWNVEKDSSLWLQQRKAGKLLLKIVSSQRGTAFKPGSFYKLVNRLGGEVNRIFRTEELSFGQLRTLQLTRHLPSLEPKKGGVISDSPCIIGLGAEPRIDISSSNCRLTSLHHSRFYHCPRRGFFAR